MLYAPILSVQFIGQLFYLVHKKLHNMQRWLCMFIVLAASITEQLLLAGCLRNSVHRLNTYYY